ncbi:MAG TPA: serine/threonine-protein kinase [Gemmataceae bacterium]|jgi:serine/threonine protein kinase|nr:serine/threonine-protein kinase [Gemmataceae bacterium]
MGPENTPLPDDEGSQPERSGASDVLNPSPPPQSEDMATLPPRHSAETQGFEAPPSGHADADVPADLVNYSRYQIVRLLGRGGMGAVYQATHRVMERSVALKMMHADFAENTALAERFRREVKAAAQLHHPNIVTAYDADQAGSTHFLVMEYVEGKNLADIVQANGPLPVAQAVDYVRQAALGLQHAFTKGMIHRDIKPHNLILTQNVPADKAADYPYGLVKILDFGLARFSGSEGAQGQTASGLILGTVDFMAPEQADNARNADIRSDIYSLGCTLYYLLAGRVPFPEGTIVQRVMAHVTQTPPPISQLRQGLPSCVVAVLERMLAKEPSKRFQTPAELANALSACLDSSATEAPTDVLDVVPIVEAVTEVAKPKAKPTFRKSQPAIAAAQPRRKSRVLLGCFLLTLAMIISFTFLGYFFIRTVIDRVGTWIDKQAGQMRVETNAWDHLDKTFTPPVQNLDFPLNSPQADQLFPRSIQNYQRQSLDLNKKFPALDFDADGAHATYLAGNQQMHLSVCQVSQDKKEAIYGRVLLKLQQQEKRKQDVKNLRMPFYEGSPTANLLRFQAPHLANPEGTDNVRGTFWYHNGWLFFLRTVDDDPTPLLQIYLQNIDTDTAPASKGTASKK